VHPQPERCNRSGPRNTRMARKDVPPSKTRRFFVPPNSVLNGAVHHCVIPSEFRVVSVFRGLVLRISPTKIDSLRGPTRYCELRPIASKPIRLRLEIICVLAVGPVLAPPSLAKNGTPQATALRRSRADCGGIFYHTQPRRALFSHNRQKLTVLSSRRMKN
jgi:hypothetical protein